jgi:hypothetical protein
MEKKLVRTWIILSFVALIAGRIWSNADTSVNNFAFHLYFDGLLSSLLAVGYYSTPSSSVYGKIAFAFVVIMVIGIASKILHYDGADAMIIIGLAGIFVTYLVMWLREKRLS